MSLRADSSAAVLSPGVTCDDAGASFVLFSANAEAVELCLYDGEREWARLPLQRDGDLWHCRIAEAHAGQRYGYRVHGPYDPSRGHRFNPNKLLIDPYARVLDRTFRVAPEHLGYSADNPALPDARDSAAVTPKCVLVRDVRPDLSCPNRPLCELVIYELHVRGMTMRRLDLPVELRGTFAGLGSDPIITHLKNLRVTAVELLPVQAIADEPRLVRAGLRNYWGYNSINFFALEPRYCAGEALAEFRAFVARYHEAGIEVILDVVFNHTGEGDEWGPTVSFRGIDNAAYYRLNPADQSRYENDAGTGNVLNIAHPRVRAMMLDSLRYWARAGVDGFRFDLATVLGKDNGDFNPAAAFFTELVADRELKGVKLIAEPWDATANGYHLGGFPPPFAEWNDKFRDVARRFWRGDRGAAAELATRMTGSSDLFASRGPLASVNFITAHDGFTLEDTVSYSTKHNLKNGEANADGAAENYSSNWGAEGETADASIRAVRDRQKRNLMATLLLSLGVPMITAGDELGRTQRGNNNAYCQDNEISWLDWSLDSGKEAFLRFVSRAIGLRAAHECSRRASFYRGVGVGNSQKDILWLAADGGEMTAEGWQAAANAQLACTFSGDNGARYFLALNAAPGEIKFVLPQNVQDNKWKLLLDTAQGDGGEPLETVAEIWTVQPRSLVLLMEG